MTKLTDLERFELKYIPEPMSGCWLWIGALTGPLSNYGCMSFRGKTRRANRVAYILFKGEIPEGLLVRHKCDNPACVNPDHLETGTEPDNHDDMHRRGRAAVGEKHPNAKLTAENVRWARSVVRLGYPEFGRNALARKLGVNPVTLHEALTYQTWKGLAEHVAPTPPTVNSGDGT